VNDVLNDPSHPDHRSIVMALKDGRIAPRGNAVTIYQDPYVANHVHRDVWMGGIPPIGMSLAENFDCLVLSACEYQSPQVYHGVQVTTAFIDDSEAPFTMEERKQAVAAAGKVISWMKDGLRVLSTCHAGRNRSGLVAAIALCKGAGLSPDQAIAAVRSARGPHALSNRNFVQFIREFCGPGR
jgi:hypothetical protein